MTDPDMKHLDDLLAEAAGTSAAPGDDLVARVLADAARVQAGFGAAPAAAPARGGLWAGLMSAIGGWPGVGGLATAGIAGLWIGVAPPAGVEALAASVLGSSTSIDLGGISTTLDLTEAFDG